ncbi:4,5-dihydroxyphthalate decarboxylase [Aminobacter sp. MSH1]|nr:ABC transporter substrate-binding protein [Aminobacter sp. MSH1]AWC20720.1 4,5-dihydroxyphthalate decarboxylase [Aminobacter sp. MSH1]
MSIKIHLAVRDWDFLIPLLRGDVASDKVDIEIQHVSTVPKNFAAEHAHDAGEISFSRYVSARGRGETDVVGVPNFVLRSFRHRCIITKKDSHIVRLEELAGKRIGLSGWQDTGSVWTRAALAHAGVGIDDAFWFLGRLTRTEPLGRDVLEGFGRPGRIEAVAGERSLLELLVAGELDAVFCPVLPEGFFSPNSELRHLLPDFRDQELAYSRAVGYVPGVHTFGVKAPLVAAHPWLPQVLSDLIDASRRMWLEQRRINVETTPWMMDELCRVARDLPASWSDSGFAANKAMIADFARQLHVQGIAPRLLSPAEIFPEYANGSGSKEEGQ